uniref:Transmembrane protein 131-like N-terminal domain-containing protein n=1 Tax=Timema monikensis TaxID=170555 RepID=A0A7R9HPK4_9NEOP|nr:unnamed protein product [Timema monikensis]
MTGGFMQANNEVRYIVDGVPFTRAPSIHKDFHSSTGVRIQIPKLVDGRTAYKQSTQLRFDPDVLDFQQRHLGFPHHERVTVHNMNNNKTIYMSSISGSSTQFHSSFFEHKFTTRESESECSKNSESATNSLSTLKTKNNNNKPGDLRRRSSKAGDVGRRSSKPGDFKGRTSKSGSFTRRSELLDFR